MRHDRIHRLIASSIVSGLLFVSCQKDESGADESTSSKRGEVTPPVRTAGPEPEEGELDWRAIDSSADLLATLKKDGRIDPSATGTRKAFDQLFEKSPEDYSTLLDALYGDDRLSKKFGVLGYLGCSSNPKAAAELIDARFFGDARWRAYSILFAEYESKGDASAIWGLLPELPPGPISDEAKRSYFRSLATSGNWDAIATGLTEMPDHDNLSNVLSSILEGARNSKVPMPRKDWDLIVQKALEGGMSQDNARKITETGKDAIAP